MSRQRIAASFLLPLALAMFAAFAGGSGDASTPSRRVEAATATTQPATHQLTLDIANVGTTVPGARVGIEIRTADGEHVTDGAAAIGAQGEVARHQFRLPAGTYRIIATSSGGISPEMVITVTRDREATLTYWQRGDAGDVQLDWHVTGPAIIAR